MTQQNILENSQENPAKRKLAAGELVLCMGLRQARTLDIVMIAAACGFDSILVDMEHSPVSLETTSLLCAGAIGLGITPLVRVPSHQRHHATRALDGGALGVHQIRPDQDPGSADGPLERLADSSGRRVPGVGGTRHGQEDVHHGNP